MALTSFEESQLKGLWEVEQSYFNRYQHISLPLGGLSVNDYNELYNLVAKNVYNTNHNMQGIKIADVGCWTGLSSLLLAQIAKAHNGRVYSVDWFRGSPATNLEFAGTAFDIKSIYKHNISQFEFADIIELREGPTSEVWSTFDPASLDVVFLDADHRYANVKQDIANWITRVKPGGVLCGHDCEFVCHNINDILTVYGERDIIEAIHPGVCIAVGELGGRKTRSHEHGFTVKESLESSIWFYKVP